MAVNTFTANLGLPVLSSDTKGAMYEFNRAMLNATMNGFLVTINRTLSDPPASPSNGDVYLVFPNGIGAWADQNDKLAYFFNGWTFITPKIGFQAHDTNIGVRWIYNNDGWFGDTVGVADVVGSTLGAIQTTIDEILVIIRQQGIILPS